MIWSVPMPTSMKACSCSTISRQTATAREGLNWSSRNTIRTLRP
jgi:hypothetical protein